MAVVHVYKKLTHNSLPVEQWKTSTGIDNTSIEYAGGDNFLMTNTDANQTQLRLWRRDSVNKDFLLIKTIVTFSDGAPNDRIFKGVTFDGRNIYIVRHRVSAGTVRIIQYDFNGNTLRQGSDFTAETEGITFDGKYLYVLNNRAKIDSIMKFSVVDLKTVIEEYFPFSVLENIDGITYDGKHFFLTQPLFIKPFGDFTNFKMVTIKGVLIRNPQFTGIQARGIATDGKLMYVIQDT